MNNHNCTIGLLYEIDYSYLATKKDLIRHIENKKEFNELVEVFKYPNKEKIWELSDYADKRKNTDLIRFDFCPCCGKRINWRELKNEQMD